MTALEITLSVAFGLTCVIAISLRRKLRATVESHARSVESERARGESRLQAESERVSAIFDRMIDGIVIVGANGQIRFANRAAGTFFGATAPMAGRTVLEATRRHEVAAVLRQLDEQPEVLDHELRLERAGEARTIMVNALALADAAGTRDGALLVFHDVTRLRQLESVRADFVAHVTTNCERHCP